AALGGGLKDRGPEQRLRCTRLLRSLEDSEDAHRVLELAFPGEKNPAIAGEMVLPIPSGALATILQQRGPWQLCAGVALALSEKRTRDSIAVLVAALQGEEGRLLDDYCDALQGLTAQTTGCDPKAWQEWWSRCGDEWQPAPLAKGGAKAEADEDDRLNPPSVFSDGPVECFGIATSSRGIVYCVDGSVQSWKFASEEVGRSIGTLPDGALFGLVICGETPVRFKKKLLAASASSRKAAANHLARFKPSGRADVCAGLLQALSMAGVDTVYFFTLRGGTWGQFTDPAQTAQEITAANRLLGVRIHAIGISAGRDAYYLQNIARQFGGTFRPLR
ncbi:MAG: vWA domain-containing protein, partial [Planctomycetota bacterium]